MLVGRFLSLDQHYFCDEDTCHNNGTLRVRQFASSHLLGWCIMQVIWDNVDPVRKARYAPMIAWMRRIAKREGIEVLRVDFHPKHRPTCHDAETDFDEKSVNFCGNCDKITILHELAHLATDSPHTRAWADLLLEYHERYLSPATRKRADRNLALNYGKGQSAYYRKYRKRVLRTTGTIRSK